MARAKTGQGSIAPGSGYTVFFQDKSADPAHERPWLFFQTWGLDLELISSYVQPEPDKDDDYTSKDYDARWRWTTILFPRWIGHGLSRPLSWKEIEEIKKEMTDGLHSLPDLQSV